MESDLVARIGVGVMSPSALQDAFDHHVWATLRLLDACGSLPPEQLEATVPGVYGSILQTLRHTVGADTWYLFVLTAGAVPNIDEDAMSLPQLRAEMARNGPRWREYLADAPDPAEVVVHGGGELRTHAPIGIRLAQALHHGTDHRSQVCTALTVLGMEPPVVEVWELARKDGRMFTVESRGGPNPSP